MMEELAIGNNVQYFRNQSGFTLSALAKEIGITPSMLSQIEHNLVNPSITTLRALSKAMNVPMFLFFKEDIAEPKLVVRKNERRILGKKDKNEAIIELLTPSMNGSIEFGIMRVPAHSSSSASPGSHIGEEVDHIISGTVSVSIDDTVYTLYEGDSVTIPPYSKHIWKNDGDENAEVIFAITPPSF